MNSENRLADYTEQRDFSRTLEPIEGEIDGDIE